MADQKPSNRERVKEIVSSIEQNIQDLFQSERYFDYLRTMSRFHSYSVNNTILIHMQRPHASMPAAGFNKWKQFGRHVKKGEKGLTIIAPTPLKKKIEEMRLDPDTKAPVLDRDGNIIIDEKTVEIPLFKPVKVFTADQTEGKPLPSLATGLTGDVQQYEAFMEALRRTSPMPISFAPLEPNTDGVCSFTKQTISIREGMSQVQTVCATVHEIGHAVLHDREKNRLSAAAGNTDKDPPKAKDKSTMEVEAESVSFAVCQYYGIDTSANSMGYIAGWSRDKSLPELKASLETITKTVSGLISTIDRHFAEICKERGIDLAAQPEQAGPDTLEQFAADLYDYMDQLHQTGILERPFTLDPREQSIADLAAEMQTGYFDGVRGPLTYLVEHNSLMTAKAMLERLDGLAQERTAPAAELADTPEKFVSDLCGYLAELQEAHLLPLPNNAELREKENMAEALLPSMLNGSFSSFRDILEDAAQRAELPVTADLRDRLEKLSDQWDAALVCKIEPIFGAGSTVDRSAVQTYRKQNDQLTPYKLVFTGTAAECQRVVAGLEAGTFTLRDMRQPDFELPPAPEQADPVQTAPDVPAPPEQPDEALYLLDDSVYLHIQASDGGWDYTLYTKHDMAQLNGGQLDSPGLSITDVVEHIRRTEEIGTLAVDLAPMEVLEELREHFTQEDAVQPDTTLDDYPMPDSSMTLDGLAELGYSGTDLLPLSRERGAELVDRDMTVYMVRTGEAPEMVFDREDLMEQPEGVMFAVPREEWEASPDFRQAVADRMDRQEDRERAFLNHGGDCFAIYQVKLDGDDSLRDIRYESLDWLNSIGRKVERGNYDLAYTAPLSEVNSADEALERLWYVFNNDHPADYQRPSMSVSDIIAIRLDGVLTCHYCDSYGFKQLPDFIQPENYLKNAEMSLEDDLGMIDGIINNGPKATVAELEQQARSGQPISLTDLAEAQRREQGEKKSVLAKLNAAPPQQGRKKTAPKKSAEKER
ncbi:YodL domain-containing protein [uncultured Oscillibacter sp.]|uniref:YodL domain-containing protein n=1 Tax=uncultured Oscillibacter sp. TaxID=876091 RepID=UPI00261F388D|nr:YodL domain-containing protein [uncultured Oscillibacter sp.]